MDNELDPLGLGPLPRPKPEKPEEKKAELVPIPHDDIFMPEETAIAVPYHDNELNHSSLVESNVPEEQKLNMPSIDLPVDLSEDQKSYVQNAFKDMVLYGAQASAMVCRGKGLEVDGEQVEKPCPYLRKCPLYQANVNLTPWVGKECPFELNAMKAWVQKYLRELGVNPHDVASAWDSQSATIMAGLELQRHRASWGEAINPLLEQELQSITPQGVINIVKIGNFNCVEATTPILTTDLEWVKAGDLVKGDKLLGFDEGLNDGKGRSRTRRWRIAEVINNGVDFRECIEIELSNGEVLVSTLDHMWLTKQWTSSGSPGWVKTEDLTDKLSILKLADTWQENRSWESGWMAGFLDGEGCVSYSRIVGNQNPGITFDKAVDIADSLYDGEISVVTECGTSSTYRFELVGSFSDRMRFLGEIRPMRLIRNWVNDMDGKFMKAREWIKVKSIRLVGKREVSLLGTTAKTYVAAGYAAHNTDYREKAIKQLEKYARANMQTRERKVALTKSGFNDMSKHAAEVAERTKALTEVEESVELSPEGAISKLSKIKRYETGKQEGDLNPNG